MTLKGVFTSIPALKDAFVSLLFHLCKVVSISFYALHSYEILMSLKQQSSFQITLRDSALIVLWWLEILILLWIVLEISQWNLITRLIAFLLGCCGIIAISVLLNFFGPTKFYYRNADWSHPETWYHPTYDTSKWNVVLDTHFHTIRSDGRMDYEQAVLWHRAVGFNAFVITDHNRVCDMEELKRVQEKYRDEMVIIPGMEYTTEEIHMTFLGLTEWDTKSISMHPTHEQLRQAVKDAHDKGAVVIVCHYPWSMGGTRPRMPNHPSREGSVVMGSRWHRSGQLG